MEAEMGRRARCPLGSRACYRSLTCHFLRDRFVRTLWQNNPNFLLLLQDGARARHPIVTFVTHLSVSLCLHEPTRFSWCFSVVPEQETVYGSSSGIQTRPEGQFGVCGLSRTGLTSRVTWDGGGVAAPAGWQVRSCCSAASAEAEPVEPDGGSKPADGWEVKACQYSVCSLFIVKK